MRDFKRLQLDPPAGISGAPQDNNIMLWNAVIFGYDSKLKNLQILRFLFSLGVCSLLWSNYAFLVFLDQMTPLGMEVQQYLLPYLLKKTLYIVSIFI